MDASKKEKHIRQQAYTLFKQVSQKSVTMDDIARHAGMSKKTIYQVYHSKKELFLSLLNDIIAGVTKKIEENINLSKNTLHEMELHIPVLSVLRENRMFFSKENLKGQPEALKAVEYFKNVNLRSFAKRHIERGVLEDIYRTKLAPENSSLIMLLLLERYVFNYSEKHDDIYSAMDFYLNGLLNDIGRKAYALKAGLWQTN
ncbi:MAG: TetR/AcrR family transcriptional regulator [Mucilaginibacter sp.]|nr:TetR/AcrR family transcriptional regulator [Mucilaginibacter sp.]